MSMESSEKPVDELWSEFVASHKSMIAHRMAFHGAKQRFLAADVDYSAFLSHNASTPFNWNSTHDFDAFMAIARGFSEEQLLSIFPALVGWATTAHRSLGTVQELILSLPREWLRENIEQPAERFLQDSSEEEYSCLLSVYEQIDRDLAIKLATRAIHETDPEIREVGEYFLSQNTTDV